MIIKFALGSLQQKFTAPPTPYTNFKLDKVSSFSQTTLSFLIKWENYEPVLR